MPLTRTYFHVLIDTPDPDGNGAILDPVEHRVEIRGADQLRAELEGKRIGVTLQESMHQTYLWAWAAMVREGHYADTFHAFRDAVLSVKNDTEAEGEPVDPTQPGATGV